MFLHEIKYCPQQGYEYDQWGNMTRGYGWGGWYSSTADNRPTYANNRIQRNPVNNLLMQYDAAGNLTFDGVQTYKYDATGQQTFASGTNLTQSYDGDGLRAKKAENNQNSYYLRSSVLGGQVIAEVSKDTGTVQWKRGIKGTYVSVEPFHLFRYLDEQTFRFNTRKGNDADRFIQTVRQIAGKRLTYEELTGNIPASH